MVRLICALVVAGLAWVVPAEGQAVQDEGFPTKGVFPEEYPEVPGVEEACGPFEVPGAFGEGCVEDSGPDAFGPVAGAGGFPNASPDPVLRTAPRLECPAAVFVEEMETGVIDCHAYDEAGEEHLDYYWEPVEGAPRGYLDAPRLTGEDRPNPSIVAPSSPFYATLESFLSEDATLRYRYRLTATSRVTGLSSRAEVEVFVLLRRPSVYCPLEYEVSAGSEIVLSCEGADPLSFRMDYEAGSSVSWEWEGLWGSNASLLSASDTPSPLFRAPLGGAGETHHYIASMTTTSSGVPRTARRRVSVRVVEGEASDAAAAGSLSAGASAPTIECEDYDERFGVPDFKLECTLNNEPPGVTYRWTAPGNPSDTTRLSATNIKNPTFSAKEYGRFGYSWTTIADKPIDYEYRVGMFDNLGAEVAYDEVTITIRNPDWMSCTPLAQEVYEGDPDVQFDCRRTYFRGGWWHGHSGSIPDTQKLRARWTKPSDEQSIPRRYIFHVPGSLPAGKARESYQYAVCLGSRFHSDNTNIGTNGEYNSTGCEYITVTVRKHGVRVDCATPDPVYEGAPNFALSCNATGPPGNNNPAYSYAWTAKGSTTDTSLLSDTGIPSPTFDVPDNVDKDETYEYLLTVSNPGSIDGTANVTVTVLNKPDIMVACAGNPYSTYEGEADIALDCTAKGAPGAPPAYMYAWTARGSTPDTDLLSATDVLSPTFYVPDNVDKDETYEYLLTVSADNAEDDEAEVTVTVLNKGALTLTCTSLDPVYEGAPDFALSCNATGPPGNNNPAYSYAWTARGSTPDTDLLSGTGIDSPTFYVPDNVDKDETYEYSVTVSAENAWDDMAEVTVTVLDRPDVVVSCADPDPVYEGSEDIELSCEARGDPDGSDYAFAWEALGATPAGLLSALDVPSPTFYVPDEVDETTRYEYRVTATAPGAEDGTADVTVTVLNTGALALTCADPDPVYEGSEDIALSCEPTGTPDGSDYAFVWEALGATPTGLLSATNISSPTFYVPDEVDETTRYEYRVTATAPGAEDGTADVTVTVLDSPPPAPVALALSCEQPPSVYEGSADIALSCEAMGDPDGSDYAFAWETRGATANTDLLSATDVPSPTFYVPDEVDETTRYEYKVMATAENAFGASADVTVTVLNKGALALTCANPAPVYEGSPDIALSCEATGAPDGSDYAYAWEARGATANTNLLSATDIDSPTFDVPDNVDKDETYEYRVRVSAENAEDATADVTVTVLNKGVLTLTCTSPDPVYEGAPDFALSCNASGPSGNNNPAYSYAWTARGSTTDTSLLSDTDASSPTFDVPDTVDKDETYEYRVTVSAANAESAAAEVTVTVLNRGALALVCNDPDPVYEGSEDIALNCSTTGAPDGSVYAYVWEARGATANTNLLSETDIDSPTFYVPDNVDKDETYEYRVTVSAENAEDAAAEVTVTVLNRDDPPLPPPTLAALALTCANPAPVYEGSEDITLNCSTTGAPDGSVYAYVWEARGATPAGMLSALDVSSPTFYVPDEVDETTRYEYGVTVTAENAEAATANVTVTVLDRTAAPDPPAVAFSGDATSLGIATSVSSLRFGAQSAGAQASLDPLTDRVSTRASGPYHAGRMTLAPDGSLAFDENGELALSIELVTPVALRHETGAATLALVPRWSIAASCEQLASESIGGLHTQTTLSESDCRLLLLGGDLDLSGAAPGRYAGNIDVILRTDAGVETHSVEAEVTVVAAPRVITIGPGGVRFHASREVPAALTEGQNLSVYPDMAFMTADEPSGAFELSNPSLMPLEVSVSARFGYAEATEDGREIVVEDASASRLGDLSEIANIYPTTLTLMPGERGVVRYGVREEALSSLEEAGYAAFFEVTSSPRWYARADRLPEEETGGETARVTLRVPGAYVPGEIAPRLKATLLSLSGGASPVATFLLETDGVPFAGEAAAYDGEGRELGRGETLTYARSRVRMPLDRLPEGEVVFLRFTPRGSGAAPEPVAVPWHAPQREGRDIGAAQDSETPPGAAFAEKP